MTTTANCINSILLVGSGRLARHLYHWNSLLEKPNTLLTWDRSEKISLLYDRLSQVNHVWLAISDSAIIPFYEKHLSQQNLSIKKIIHFSGALHDDRLISAHPMMSFSWNLYEASIYKNIHFGLTGVDHLQEALPNFSNSFFTISANNKSFYHALCVVAGNFPQLLWSEVEKKLTDLHIPEKALAIYLEQTLANYLSLRENALTGPIARKDFTTILKNQLALENTKLQSIYQSFVKEFAP